MSVRQSTDDDPPDGPGQESGTEGCQRQQQARGRILRGEKCTSDLQREKRKREKVVKLKRIAHEHGNDVSHRQFDVIINGLPHRGSHAQIPHCTNKPVIILKRYDEQTSIAGAGAVVRVLNHE